MAFSNGEEYARNALKEWKKIKCLKKKFWDKNAVENYNYILQRRNYNEFTVATCLDHKHNVKN